MTLASGRTADAGDDGGRTGAFFAALCALVSGGVLVLRRRFAPDPQA